MRHKTSEWLEASLKLILPWAKHSVYKENVSFIKMSATKIFVQEENLALAPRGFMLWSYFFLIKSKYM